MARVRDGSAKGWQLEQQAESLHLEPKAQSKDCTGDAVRLWNVKACPQWQTFSIKATPSKPSQNVSAVGAIQITNGQ